jgi:hypothetical protein
MVGKQRFVKNGTEKRFRSQTTAKPKKELFNKIPLLCAFILLLPYSRFSNKKNNSFSSSVAH